MDANKRSHVKIEYRKDKKWIPYYHFWIVISTVHLVGHSAPYVKGDSLPLKSFWPVGFANVI